MTITGCSGDAGETTLTIDDQGNFAIGQKILIHKSRGNTSSTCGTWELNQITSVSANSLGLLLPLGNTYVDSGNDQSQVQTLPQYTTFTLNENITLTNPDWDTSSGGILAFACSGQAYVNGTIDGNGATGAGTGGGATSAGGFHGGNGSSQGPDDGDAGEGTTGPTVDQTTANGSGGGGGQGDGGSQIASGGGGGNGVAGTVGSAANSGVAGDASGTSGNVALTLMTFGGGGGGGNGTVDPSDQGGGGGSGGGIILIMAKEIILGTNGIIRANGGTGGGQAKVLGQTAGGGGGGGGSILIKSVKATIGSNKITAIGGTVSTAVDVQGGIGGDGRIRIDSCSVVAGGATNPTYSSSLGHSWCGSLASIIL